MIDYRLISDSIDHYLNVGFTRIETPWAVSGYVTDLTKPEGATSFKLAHNDKCLVASGEQSFLYLYLKDFLPKGQFQTVTPCYRYENFDYTHTKYFIKNELIKTDKVNDTELDAVTEHCLRFFRTHIPEAEIVKTKIGFDIEYKGYELGSYGIRENEFLRWIYATGCAEPRLTRTIKIYRNGIS